LYTLCVLDTLIIYNNTNNTSCYASLEFYTNCIIIRFNGCIKCIVQCTYLLLLELLILLCGEKIIHHNNLLLFISYNIMNLCSCQLLTRYTNQNIFVKFNRVCLLWSLYVYNIDLWLLSLKYSLNRGCKIAFLVDYPKGRRQNELYSIKLVCRLLLGRRPRMFYTRPVIIIIKKTLHFLVCLVTRFKSISNWWWW